MKSIEVGPYKTMAPEPTLTPRTSLGPGPGKLATQLKNPLDADLNKQYQWTVVFAGITRFLPGQRVLLTSFALAYPHK